MNINLENTEEIKLLNSIITHLERDSNTYYNLWRKNCRNSKEYEHYYQMYLLCRQSINDALEAREEIYQAEHALNKYKELLDLSSRVN